MAGGQPNMEDLLRQAQQMQDDILSAQEKLTQTEVKGTAGGGLVTATVSGSGELIGLDIDPAAVDADDPAETAETIADLVLAAVRDAMHAAGGLQAETMGSLTQGLGGLGGLSGLAGPQAGPHDKG